MRNEACQTPGCGHDPSSHYAELVMDHTTGRKLRHERGSCLCFHCGCKRYTRPGEKAA